ncbi:MAG: hypothetical protein LBO07_00590 [Coriobacteriales bacterium]|nr:hypothetical protein [Coriobacteriales bacterium]
MRFDYAQYTYLAPHLGNRRTRSSTIRLQADDDLFAAVICEGLGGPDQGETVARFAAERIRADIRAGLAANPSAGSASGLAANPSAGSASGLASSLTANPSANPSAGQSADLRATPQASLAPALLHAHQALCERQLVEPAMRTARSTAATFALDPTSGALSWATIGDSRVYLFQNGATGLLSPDDSAGYAAYLRGETDYEGIRLLDSREVLTASLGEPSEPVAHEGVARFAPGDALLVCSNGFWEYVFDLEAWIDLQKSDSAEEWLRLMLLRLVERSCLAGNAFCAVVCRALE